jgi:hypothetical protein
VGTGFLGRDLMSKLKIIIKRAQVSWKLMTAQAENPILPEVWTKDGKWEGWKILPIHIALRTLERQWDENNTLFPWKDNWA